MDNSPISQAVFFAEVLKALERLGVSDLNSRQINGVIRGVDTMLLEVNSPHRSAYPRMGLGAWMASDDVGLSSKYMAYCLEEFWIWPKPENNYPHDPGDFGRCVMLLDAVPKFRERMQKMREGHGPQWTALIAAWDELEALYREELPTGKAPRLRTRMNELLQRAKNQAD